MSSSNYSGIVEYETIIRAGIEAMDRINDQYLFMANEIRRLVEAFQDDNRTLELLWPYMANCLTDVWNTHRATGIFLGEMRQRYIDLCYVHKIEAIVFIIPEEMVPVSLEPAFASNTYLTAAGPTALRTERTRLSACGNEVQNILSAFGAVFQSNCYKMQSADIAQCTEIFNTLWHAHDRIGDCIQHLCIAFDVKAEEIEIYISTGSSMGDTASRIQALFAGGDDPDSPKSIGAKKLTR